WRHLSRGVDSRRRAARRLSHRHDLHIRRRDAGLSDRLSRLEASEVSRLPTRSPITRSGSGSRIVRISFGSRLFRIGRTVNSLKFRGAERDRTVDLLNAIQALSQLSYSPDESSLAGFPLWALARRRDLGVLVGLEVVAVVHVVARLRLVAARRAERV